MNGEPTTGPLTLGRWQQPAALILAGRVTPDPYPLEQILFCATCGQQFFGTHLTGGTDQSDSTRVTGTHFISTRDADQPDGARVYRTSCNCRPEALPASEVELRVYAETHVHVFGTDTVAGLTSTHYAVLAIRVFSRVELGSTVDEITFTNRI